MGLIYTIWLMFEGDIFEIPRAVWCILAGLVGYLLFQDT